MSGWLRCSAAQLYGAGTVLMDYGVLRVAMRNTSCAALHFLFYLMLRLRE